MFVSRDAVMEFVYSSRPYPAVKITFPSSVLDWSCFWFIIASVVDACAIEEEGVLMSVIEDRVATCEMNCLLFSFEDGTGAGLSVDDEIMLDQAWALNGKTKR